MFSPPQTLSGTLAGAPAPYGVRFSADGRIQIYIYIHQSCSTADILRKLKAAGVEVQIANEEFRVVQGWADPAQLDDVAALSCTSRIALPAYGVPQIGSVTSEGDAILHAADVRLAPPSGFGVNGSGVRVGVISDGVNGLATSQSRGDLGTVTVLDPGCGASFGCAEGTAMLEIVHDLAPGAVLGFYGPSTSVEFCAGVAALRTTFSAGVIVDDLAFPAEPYFEDGMVAQCVRDALSAGVVYVTSAGNYALQHYQGTYTDSFDGWGTHQLGPGNTVVEVWGSPVTVILQWSDPFGASSNDYDLCFSSDSPAVCALYNTWQHGQQNPIEGLVLNCPSGCSLEIRRFSGQAQTLELFALRGADLLPDDRSSQDSIFGHAAIEGVLAVAAIDAADPNHGSVESFSSRGNSTIAFPSRVTRKKPDVAAIDGVLVTGVGGFSSPFYGTSAAAPHVAAIAALVKSANPLLTATQISNLLRTTAIDIGPAGRDTSSGFGRADALLAVAGAIPKSPTPIRTRTPTPVGTPTLTPTRTRTLTPTPTLTRSPTPTITPTPLALPDTVQAKSAAKCQQTIAKAGAKLVSNRLKSLASCAAGVLHCTESQGSDSTCFVKAAAACNKKIAALGAGDAKLQDAILKACSSVGIGELRADNGLGYESLALACEAVGSGLDAPASLAGCVSRVHACHADRILGAQLPRARGLMENAGVSTGLLAGLECLPNEIDDGASAGPMAGSIERCAATVRKSGRALVATELGVLGKCLTSIFGCEQAKPGGFAPCMRKVAPKCQKGFAALPGVRGKIAAQIQTDCGAVPFAILASAAGANFDVLAADCASRGVTLVSLQDYSTCLVRHHECQVKNLVRTQVPRVDQLLGRVDLVDVFPEFSCPVDDAEPTVTPTSSPVLTPSSSPTPTESIVPATPTTASPDLTPTANGTPTATETPTETVTAAPTPSPTATETVTPIPTESVTPTETQTFLPTPTETPSETATESVTPAADATDTPTPTVTDVPQETASATPTPFATETTMPTPVSTATPVPTDTATPDETIAATPLPSPTEASSPTEVPTETLSPTPEIATPTIDVTETPAPTETPLPSETSSPEPTPAE
jgi:subtilisin family serine protease